MEIRTLQEAMAFYAVPQNCIDFMVSLRWPDGKVACPTCGSEAVTWMPTRSLFQCKGKHPKRQFSVKVGTLMEDSPIALSKWLIVAWMLGSCRNGISSYEVARTIGITQKSAWFMLHRLRDAMESPSQPLQGVVEADETYIGPKLKNKHRSKLKQGKYNEKTPVFGMVERGGRVIAKVLESNSSKEILPIMAESIEPKSKVYTDGHGAYDHLRWVGKSFKHEVINHHQNRFARGRVNTNTIENFWACLKRTLAGTYIAVRPKHLAAYVQESAFRFNVRRGFTEHERFAALVAGTHGRRLTYRQLTQ